jgi:ABC-type cobalamin/Fe3+-siderophores transport system ATPase subunit
MVRLFSFTIKNILGDKEFEIESGSSIYFVGANGSGKSRLSASIENSLGLDAHRISAHRALSLNPGVPKISEQNALNMLRMGGVDGNVQHRTDRRWSRKSSTILLNDYDSLIQSLFAEQSNRALDTHNKNRADDLTKAPPTKFETLKEIWEGLIPHRKLKITGDNISILTAEDINGYDAGDMSDGERAIFYLIGQTLCAKDNSVLIIDEPELHIHRSIMSKLWDRLESLRMDCSFIFVSHDLEFVASRVGKKYVISDYNPPETWKIDDVPSESGFGEEITTQILGSRTPILFIEGQDSSLDLSIYRSCYPEFTVIPRGSCDDVIYSVVTMRANQIFTHITCAGIIDLDDRSQDEVVNLNKLGIKVLPVSELENLFIVPEIIRAIGIHEGYEGDKLDAKLNELMNAVIANVNYKDNLEEAVARHCARRVHRSLKKIDVSIAKDVLSLATAYAKETSALDINEIASSRRSAIKICVENNDLMGIASLYDNKGILSIVASIMKNTKLENFTNWLVRIIINKSAPSITAAFKQIIPKIIPE